MDVLPDVMDLRLVDAIGETGAIGSAAAELHMSQPSASQRLAVLERRLGAVLFERDTTGARLTAEGESFLVPARRALLLLEEAVSAARLTGRAPSGGRDDREPGAYGFPRLAGGRSRGPGP